MATMGSPTSRYRTAEKSHPDHGTYRTSMPKETLREKKQSQNTDTDTDTDTNTRFLVNQCMSQNLLLYVTARQDAVKISYSYYYDEVS